MYFRDTVLGEPFIGANYLAWSDLVLYSGMSRAEIKWAIIGDLYSTAHVMLCSTGRP